MFDREHLSYSQVNQFLRICPLQFALQRVFKLKPEFVTEAMPFGSAVHRTAEYLWANRMDGKDVTEDQLAELFADVWKREVAETENLRYQKGDFDSLLQQGQELMRVYRHNFPADCEIVGYNVPFQVPLIDQHGEMLEEPLVGEIDLLLKYDNRLCAVDLKTSAQRYAESKIASDLQPTVYLYALRLLGYADVFFRWDVLVKTKTPALVQYPVDRGENDFHRLVELIKAMKQLIAAGCFIPNDGSHFCPGCGFQATCRDWHLNPIAAAPQEPHQLATC